jgi:predicted glycosyltransferase
MKKILIYSHDTYGLGNIRRMLAIAESIQSEFKDVSVLLLSGSPMIQSFRITSGIDYIKLPCLSRDASESYKAKSLRISKDCISKLRADLILNTVRNFEPDLILVDKKPLGVDNELAPTLEYLQQQTVKPKLALVLRDILDIPEKTIAVWNRNRYHDVIRDFYDCVLVLGSTDVFNIVEEYSFPETTAEKTFFCGYITKPDPQRSPSAVREELGIDGRRLVLATTGGGEDGASVARVVLQTVQQYGNEFADHCLLFLGPEMPESEQNRFCSWASGLTSVTVKNFSSDFNSYLGAADAVVAMGGYNTVAEILSLDMPAVIVPRTYPVSEQQIRAARLERLGLLETLSLNQLFPEQLFWAVTNSLKRHQSSANNRHQLNLAALPQVVGHVRRLLNDQGVAYESLITVHNELDGVGCVRSSDQPSDTALDNLVPVAKAIAESI